MPAASLSPEVSHGHRAGLQKIDAFKFVQIDDDVALAADGHVIDTDDRDVIVADFSGSAPFVSTPWVFHGHSARDL